MNKIVFNIEPAATSDVRAMDAHERYRKPDGTSAIDPSRRHFNQTLHGPAAGPMAALTMLFQSGVGRPTQQAEAPYLRIVLSASPAYFRPSAPEAHGTWDSERLENWTTRASAWLQDAFGPDAVHVALHLDEDTPHLHALVVPTYERRRRTPGKQTKTETPEEFEARRAAARNAPGVRTVGRASHPTLRKRDSFEALRRDLARTMAPLGLSYGDVRTPDAPEGISGREFVRREAVRLRELEAAIDRDREMIHQRAVKLDNIKDDLLGTAKALKSEKEDLLAERRKIENDHGVLIEMRRRMENRWHTEKQVSENRRKRNQKIENIQRQRQRSLEMQQSALDDLLAAAGAFLDVPPEIAEIRQKLEALEYDEGAPSDPDDSLGF